MAPRDIYLMQGNVLQSVVVSFVAGGFLMLFKPNVETMTRFGRSVLVGSGKRAVNTAAIYVCCTGLDFLRRNGMNFWYLNNKVAAEGTEEYFLSSTFRFVTFAASSGASCMTNWLTKLVGLYGPRKQLAAIEDADDDNNASAQCHEIETTSTRCASSSATGLTGYMSRLMHFYDVEGSLRPYTNLARLAIHTSLYGLNTVIAGSGLLPVTMGPIDEETHVRVLRQCGPAELAYWSSAVALSTLSAETVWNILFWISTYGSDVVIEGEDGSPAAPLGFTIISNVVISIAAAVLNGSTVYVVSNRAVATLGEDGEKQQDSTMHTICKVIHDNVFCRVFNKDKGVAYVWSRCIGYLGSVVSK